MVLAWHKAHTKIADITCCAQLYTSGRFRRMSTDVTLSFFSGRTALLTMTLDVNIAQCVDTFIAHDGMLREPRARPSVLHSAKKVSSRLTLLDILLCTI